MLHNPWQKPIGEYEGTSIDQIGLTSDLKKLALRKLGANYESGFGYGSSVAIGKHTVLKVAPYPAHRGRFDHELAVAGITLPGVNVPTIVDSGITDDYEWIEIERVDGSPAYETWDGLTGASRYAIISRLTECIAEIQRFVPREQFLFARFNNWRDHVEAQFERTVVRAKPIVPAPVLDEAIEFKRAHTEHLCEKPRVLCHGDLWFGNLLLNDAGELVGIIDWDRLAVAPADYEMDMTWRFWRYPWDFVPEQFAQRFQHRLDPELLVGLVGVSGSGCHPEELGGRLSMLELTYRLGVVARFGWSKKHHMMLNNVLSGQWAKDLENLATDLR